MTNTTKPTLTHPLIKAEHLNRMAIIYVRQSSLEQVEHNTGSQAFQRSQFDVARDYGWPADRIAVIDEDLGKSGSTLDQRTGWKRMMDAIASNTVGAVFAANVSRLGRQMGPIEDLRVLASYHGTLLCLDNRFSDPANPNDTVLTQITASIAQYENRKRAEHMSNARMAKARQGAVDHRSLSAGSKDRTASTIMTRRSKRQSARSSRHSGKNAPYAARSKHSSRGEGKYRRSRAHVWSSSTLHSTVCGGFSSSPLMPERTFTEKLSHVPVRY